MFIKKWFSVQSLTHTDYDFHCQQLYFLKQWAQWRRGGVYVCFFSLSFFLRQAGKDHFQYKMSNSNNCVYLTWFIWWLWFGKKPRLNHPGGEKKQKWPFGESPSTYSMVWGKGNGNLRTSEKKIPHCDCDPVLGVMWPVPPAETSATHSLWNLSSFAAAAQLSLSTSAWISVCVCAQVGNAATHLKKKKAPAVTRFPVHQSVFII